MSKTPVLHHPVKTETPEANELLLIQPQTKLQYDTASFVAKELTQIIARSWDTIKFLSSLSKAEYIAWMNYAYTHPVQNLKIGKVTKRLLPASSEGVRFSPPKTWQEMDKTPKNKKNFSLKPI